MSCKKGIIMRHCGDRPISIIWPYWKLSAARWNMDSYHEMCSQGNDGYRAGDFAAAVEAYTRAISLLSSSEPQDSGRQLLLQLHSNRAQAYLQLREHTAALADCNVALKLHPTSVKVLIRRATASLALERVGSALSDLDAAQKLRPEASLLKTIHVLKEQARRMRTMLDGPGAIDADAREADGLVSEKQCLRLHIKQPPPASVRLCESWSTSLFLANEFGLWRRAHDFPSECESLPLLVTVFDRGGPCLEASKEVSVEIHGEPPLLVKGSSCRVEIEARLIECRGQSVPNVNGTCMASSTTPKEVHLMFSLPSHQLHRHVMPVFSLPIAVHESLPPEDQQKHELVGRRKANELGVASCRGFHVSALGRRLLVAEAPGHLGLGGKVWDAGLVLLEYLSGGGGEALKIRGKRCLELGAGTGFVGVACALLGADVVITDLEQVVPLIDVNIELNMPEGRAQAGRACAVAHVWGEPLAHPQVVEPFDYVIMSDVVYDPKCYQALVDSLLAFMREETTVVLAHRDRHPDNAQFFELAAQNLEINQVPFVMRDHEEEGEGQRGQETAPVNSPHGYCSDVKIYLMRLKEVAADVVESKGRA